MADRYVCFACRRRIAVRPSGQLYPHGPGCPGAGHRLLPDGPSGGTGDTAWFQARDTRRITTARLIGGVL